MKTVKDFRKGDKVTYVPAHTLSKESHPDREYGVVTSVNDTYVFFNGKACKPEDLRHGDMTFYCPDEHNSVLDGAFGRCLHECNNCKRVKFIEP